MKYLCLIYYDEQRVDEMSDEQWQALVARCLACSEELSASGHMLAGEPLQAVSTARTVRVRDGVATVVDGPFAETRELIAGFWLFQTASLQEAINWVRRCPPSAIGEAEIEIRQVFEAEDFGAEFTPELREQEERLRAQLNH